MITAPRPVPPDDRDNVEERRGPLRPILWRLHFLTGFAAGPIVVWLCLTGILFAWNPQIESAIYDEALTARSDAAPRPLSEQVQAATDANPGLEVVSITPAAAEGGTTAVLLRAPGASAEGFGPATGDVSVYVDPGTAAITGRIEEAERPDEWLRNLHSNFRLGTGAGTLTELAASLTLVSLGTGLYLWWPKTRAAMRRSLLPRLRGLRHGGRRPWRDLHAALGVITVGALAVMVVTGLTWTEYAGRWVDITKQALVKEPPTLQTTLGASAAGSGGHGHAGHGAGGGGTGDPVGLGHVDRVRSVAEHSGIGLPYVIAPPAAPGQAWSVAEVDNRWPIRQQTVAIDPQRGTVIDRVPFSDNPLLEQATTLGIGFHEGTLFGLVNQIGLTVLALALIGLVCSGYVMWWRRRPPGALAAPSKRGPLPRTVPVVLLAGFGLLMLLLPTLAVAFAAYLVAERLVARPTFHRNDRSSSGTPVA
jgi:uncharacterized iron-regulated membrane protein